MRRYLLAPMALLLLIAAVGCSSSGGSKTSSPVCSALKSLKSSVNTLKQTDVTKPDVNKIKADIQAVGTDVANLVSVSKSQFSKQANAIQQDYKSLKSAVKIAVQNPSYPTIAQIKTEFTTLANSVNYLAQTAAAGC